MLVNYVIIIKLSHPFRSWYASALSASNEVVTESVRTTEGGNVITLCHLLTGGYTGQSQKPLIIILNPTTNGS